VKSLKLIWNNTHTAISLVSPGRARLPQTSLSDQTEPRGSAMIYFAAALIGASLHLGEAIRCSDCFRHRFVGT
jgi:hypothetical protein